MKSSKRKFINWKCKKEYERRREKSLKDGKVEHSKHWDLLALEAGNKILECKGKIKLYAQTREKKNREGI